MANDIDPKILATRTHLAQLRRQSAQMGMPPDDEIEMLTTPQLTGMPPEPVRVTEGLPTLRGSEAQIKWALTIRANTLKLSWPVETAAMLASIVDATWWIANKTIVTTMKFKAPSPQQMTGSVPTAAASTGRPQTPGASSLAPASTPSSRLNDAAAFAESVSRHPLTAEATILALLAKLYKSPMKDELLKKAREKRKQANFEITRDVDAIDRLLA